MIWGVAIILFIEMATVVILAVVRRKHERKN